MRTRGQSLAWAVLHRSLAGIVHVLCTRKYSEIGEELAAASREQAARAARAETMRARAELEALRSQLNPRFILNTFHALIGLVRNTGDERLLVLATLAPSP